MWLFKPLKRIICPFCLTEIRTRNDPDRCPSCHLELPVLYLNKYENHPPFFVQVFGWSRHGKTVFLSALTLMLKKMSNVWSRYTPYPATEATQRKMQEINEYLAKGVMPPLTQLGPQEVYIMVLEHMERWGGRTLVTRDCAGEIFDNFRIPVDQAPYLLNAPTTFMLISLSDLANSGGRSIDMLMDNYINTLISHKHDFDKEKRKIVVVLTKADKMDLPPNLRNYLVNDPLWMNVNQLGIEEYMSAAAMEEYMQSLTRVSQAVSRWLQRDDAGKTFVRKALNHNVDLRFSLISSTGAEVGDQPVRIAPRRILDPYFWALELQSRPLIG